MNPARKINLDILCYRDGENYAAHCLQLDIVAEAETKDQAISELVALIVTHTEYTIENDDWDNYYKLAPEIYWQLLAKAQPEGEFLIQVPEKPKFDMSMIYSLNKWRSGQNLYCE